VSCKATRDRHSRTWLDESNGDEQRWRVQEYFNGPEHGDYHHRVTEAYTILPRSSEDGLFYGRLRSRCPHLSEDEARQIAGIWSNEMEIIITRMKEISDASVGPALHIEARIDAIEQMAMLRAYLSQRMLAKKLGDDAAAAGLTAAKERAAVLSQLGRECVENTAKNLAEIWISLVLKWRKKWPLVVTPDSAHDRPKPVSKPKRIANAPGVRNNHYSPASSNKPWASGTQNQVKTLTCNPDGTLRSQDMSYRSWGKEQFLYSLRLERYLALVDDDGARSRDKIIAVRPLTDLDKRRWIAFLIVQMLRTPAFMRQLTENTKRILPDIAPDYPSTPGALKTAYETLFTNNDVYTRFHEMIAPRTWTVLRAPTGSGFIRPDSTILVEGNIRDSTWRLAYPMTPRKVFLVGPGMGGGYDQDFVKSIETSPNSVVDLNRRFARSANSSVLVHANDYTDTMRSLLAEHLPVVSSSIAYDHGLWGPLSNPSR